MFTLQQPLQNLKLNAEFKYTLKVWATSILIFWSVVATAFIIGDGFRNVVEPFYMVIGFAMLLIWISFTISFIPMLIFYFSVKKIVNWKQHTLIKKIVLSLSLILIMAVLFMLIDGNPIRPWVTLLDYDTWFMCLLSLSGILVVKMPKPESVKA